MDEHAMAALRKKKKSYGNYLKSKHDKDYLEYVSLRNKALQSRRSVGLLEIMKKILLKEPRKIQRPSIDMLMVR